MAKKRKYQRPRKLGSWVTVKGSTRKYKTMRGVVNFVFKDEDNYRKLLDKLHENSPEQFENKDFVRGALWGKENDKKAVLEFVRKHAETIYRDMKDKNSWTSLEEALSNTLNTRTFVSQDELAVTNLKKFLKQQNDQAKTFRDKLREKLHVNKINYDDIAYSKNITIETVDESGNVIVETGKKGYVFKDKNIAITLTGSGTKTSPYTFELHINKSTSV